jgi:hypothetical protein
VDLSDNHAAERHAGIETIQPTVFEKINSRDPADPKAARAIFSQRGSAVERSTARRHCGGKDSIFKSGQTAIPAADPNHAQMILKDWINNIRREPSPGTVEGYCLAR